MLKGEYQGNPDEAKKSLILRLLKTLLEEMKSMASFEGAENDGESDPVLAETNERFYKTIAIFRSSTLLYIFDVI